MLLQYPPCHVSTILLTFDSGRENCSPFHTNKYFLVKSIRLRVSGHTAFQAVGKYGIYKMNNA